jgi:transcriptional regulator with XRE-family HTH domain
MRGGTVATSPGRKRPSNHIPVRIVGFGQRLRALREARGLSQRALCRAAGLGETTVCLWELEHCLPDANSLVALADALGVTTDELLGRK